MEIIATVVNSFQKHEAFVATAGNQKTVSIPGKVEGYGSSLNGGELLFLALATCFCNDLYREAPRRNMKLESVEVTVSGNFGKEGEPCAGIRYGAKVVAPGVSEGDIAALIRDVDKVAEIHNTLRRGVNVDLQP